MDTLEDMCFATPQLFDKLVQLRRKLRNTYEAGTKTSSQLHQIPFSKPLSNSTVVQGVNQNEDQANGASNEAHDTEQVEEEDEHENR